MTSYYIDDSLKSDKLSRAVLNFFFFRVLFVYSFNLRNVDCEQAANHVHRKA